MYIVYKAAPSRLGLWVRAREPQLSIKMFHVSGVLLERSKVSQ
jgi:hypothetical protein